MAYGTRFLRNIMEIKYMINYISDDQKVINDLIRVLCIKILEDYSMHYEMTSQPLWSRTLAKYWKRDD